MNIYSITEIVQATNDFLKPKTFKPQNKDEKKNRLPPKTEIIIKQADEVIPKKKENFENSEKPLILKDDVLVLNKEKINSFNYKIKIKPQVKDHMINELYLFLKKKIKKNTLKLIIDEQVEIKNLKYRIIFLEKDKNRLINDYQILKNNYEISLEKYKQLKINYEQLSIENDELKIDNKVLQDNLNHAKNNQEQLSIENDELKIDNKALQDNLNHVKNKQEQLSIKNNELKINLQEAKANNDEYIVKNRSFEINNSELKNTVSRYIINAKKLQEKLTILENSKDFDFKNENNKLKFYQDENIRLSSELLSTRVRNQTIKQNLDNIEIEKEKISVKIKELGKSIEQKANIVPVPFVKETQDNEVKNTDLLNNKEQKSLDEVINRIFAKI